MIEAGTLRVCAAVLVASALGMFAACASFHPEATRTDADTAPYVDSTGYRAALERLETVDRSEDGALIAQALYVPESAAEKVLQPRFFQSIEESYQRYLGLFRPAKKTQAPALRCDFDLAETVRRGVFDAQPFYNAMLHTMGLGDLSTLDFSVETAANDTLVVRLQCARSLSRENSKTFSITETTVTLACTRHAAHLIAVRP